MTWCGVLLGNDCVFAPDQEMPARKDLSFLLPVGLVRCMLGGVDLCGVHCVARCAGVTEREERFDFHLDWMVDCLEKQEGREQCDAGDEAKGIEDEVHFEYTVGITWQCAAGA